jgi:hypothetical protein
VTPIRRSSDHGVTIGIGGLIFSIASEELMEGLSATGPWHRFVSSDRPDVRIRCRTVEFHRMNLPARGRQYADGDCVSIYRFDRRVFLVFGPVHPTGRPFMIAVSTDEFRTVRVYVNRSYGPEFAQNAMARLLQYPLMPIVMTYALAANEGIMVHACGIAADGKGYAFVGKCGEGKSTMAKLWEDRGVLLNDERVVIRRCDGRFMLYGTPWSGECGSTSPAGIPLEAIFFLSHGEDDCADLTTQAESAALLLARSFPPLWDKHGLQSCLEFISGLVAEVSSYRLRFVPRRQIVEFIRRLF